MLEASKYTYTYDRLMDHYKITLDAYFKRTQMMMIAIQAGLIFALFRILPSISTTNTKLASNILLALLGFLGSFTASIWFRQIIRHHGVL